MADVPQHHLLIPAEGPAKLHPVGRSPPRGIGAKPEVAAILAVRAGDAGASCPDWPIGVQEGPVPGETRRQIRPVGEAKPAIVIIWPVAPFGQVEQ